MAFRKPKYSKRLNVSAKFRSKVGLNKCHVTLKIDYFIAGSFSVRSAQGRHHTDSDFNEIWYIGLFCPTNKLV